MIKIAFCDITKLDIKIFEELFDKIANKDYYEYDAYTSIKEILNLAEESTPIYHVYILDAEYSKISGYKLALKLRKKAPSPRESQKYSLNF